MKLMEMGHKISFPFSHNAHYDLIVDNGKDLLKVQVKRAYKAVRSGRPDYIVCENRRFTGNGKTSYGEDSFDFLITHYPESNDLWVIPYEVRKNYKSCLYVSGKNFTEYKNRLDLI